MGFLHSRRAAGCVDIPRHCHSEQCRARYEQGRIEEPQYSCSDVAALAHSHDGVWFLILVRSLLRGLRLFSVSSVVRFLIFSLFSVPPCLRITNSCILLFSRKVSSRFLRFSDHRITRSPDHPIFVTIDLRSSATICGRVWLWFRCAVSPCLRGEILFLEGVV